MRFLNAFLSGIILLVKCSYVHQKYEKKITSLFLKDVPLFPTIFFSMTMGNNWPLIYT